MSAYYNEFDPQTAAWLRELIAQGHIAPGDVDERSIEDVHPSDLRGYTQCHFFAGIGGWSLALRLAGWADARPVWTGSCPCQPFSAAGKGLAFADERHLWPAFGHLVAECRPPVVVGEQVAGKDADVWIDLVHADMESMGYAFGCVPFPSAGCGSPQLRDRNYWAAVGQADSNNARLEGRKLSTKRAAQFAAGAGSLVGKLGDAASKRRGEAGRIGAGPEKWSADAGATLGGMADTTRQRWSGWPTNTEEQTGRRGAEICGSDRSERPGPINGRWRVADWLGCTDGRWRAVEPGTFPLADGIPNRVGRLRAYGNSINPEAGRVFMESLMECMP